MKNRKDYFNWNVFFFEKSPCDKTLEKVRGRFEASGESGEYAGRGKNRNDGKATEKQEGKKRKKRREQGTKRYVMLGREIDITS